MKKFLSILSTIIISLFILAIFGWMVNQLSTGKRKFGVFTEPIKFMYSFPDLFQQSVEEVNSLPKTFIPTPQKFKPINALKKDLIVLTSYSENDSTRAVELKNLKDGSVKHKWSIHNRHSNIARIFHPMYLEDGSIVYTFSYTWDGLEKLDSSGNVIWTQKDVLFHHGMELDNDGNIWACTKEKMDFINGKINVFNEARYYMDYTFTKVDAETGEILFHKSISEILKENNLVNYFYKAHKLQDPLHLNDVQPALKTTEFYQEGDVFLSLRTISCILHYRPETNELIDVIEGPFVSQHDVDLMNDSTLSIFNNQFYDGSFKGTKWLPPSSKDRLFEVGTLRRSSIVTYDLRNQSFGVVGDSIFETHGIFTASEGLQELIDENTYFVEEQNSGELWVFENDKVIYKDVLPSHHEGHHHLPNWTRVISYQ